MSQHVGRVHVRQQSLEKKRNPDRHTKLLHQQHATANPQIIVEVLEIEPDQNADHYNRDSEQSVLLQQKKFGI